MRKHILKELSPLTVISDTLRQAMQHIAEGKSHAEAANLAGMQENSLRTRLAEPEGKAAMRAIHEQYLEDQRGKLRRELLAKAGVLPGTEPSADEELQVKCILEALGMIGDSAKAQAMRVRYGDRTVDQRLADEAEADAPGAVMPQLVINITSAGATSDGVTIEHGED